MHSMPRITFMRIPCGVYDPLRLTAKNGRHHSAVYDHTYGDPRPAFNFKARSGPTANINPVLSQIQNN